MSELRAGASLTKGGHLPKSAHADTQTAGTWGHPDTGYTGTPREWADGHTQTPGTQGYPDSGHTGTPQHWVHRYTQRMGGWAYPDTGHMGTPRHQQQGSHAEQAMASRGGSGGQAPWGDDQRPLSQLREPDSDPCTHGDAHARGFYLWNKSYRERKTS